VRSGTFQSPLQLLLLVTTLYHWPHGPDEYVFGNMAGNVLG
jgi:hypothetical protein